MENLFKKYTKIWLAKENSLNTLFKHIQHYQIEVDDYDNITVKNTSEKNVPGFCCHLDTVHKEGPLPICVNNVLFDTLGNGVGGDDKCGIVACLELLEKVPCKCVFFTEEETGATGSRHYDIKNLSDCKYLIEIDRKGTSDLIFESGQDTLCSQEFQEEIEKHFKGYKKQHGIFTDVNVLGDAKINMMNISCGYFLPHTNNEYVLLDALGRTIQLLTSFAKKDLTFKPYVRKERLEYPEGNLYGTKAFSLDNGFENEWR